MNRIIVLFGAILIGLLLIGVASAEDGIDITIKNGTLIVEGYSITSFAGKVKTGFIDRVNDSFSSSISCISMNITEANSTGGNGTIREIETNCTINLDYHKEIPFNFNGTESVFFSDDELQRKYETCLEEKATYKVGYTTCTSNNFDKEGLEANLTKCSSDLQVCKSERSAAEADKNEMEQETEDTKNQKWTFGIGGLIVGVIGTLWYTGRIGGPKAKSGEESYNPQQAA